MIEDEARAWVHGQFGDAGVAKLQQIAQIVIAESARQNLIAASTIPEIWSRHLVDSAQLILLARDAPGMWLDIGSGAGFPGLVVAALTERSVHLVEPRAKRAAFLVDAAAALGIGSRVVVHACRIESVRNAAQVISARAVAALPTLLDAALPCSTSNTLWLLPKGQSAHEEVANAERAWHGVFHVEQSITNPASQIVVARGVARRCK
ncbi:16S rRNA (guanine(527)-N(7))-methyltransferase RsmG [Sphingomonas immobilis]|uniref:Ribosomal RNA small subunit methyltransferase G n=1 Tax=Sphingomonas immobilis TaxID=3063997 RepID=A0ABT8ZVV3_9SPHN|nr:16S rRNA (guanine(527)-N(7))-methyltransferase RsmG [Sphingomonas sp. CA1-15]MDO7841413.1 16S rRNA (guanine(527)-N(7))-methyltransferase RsmG [Sphingomonas sp. CA1-15]